MTIRLFPVIVAAIALASVASAQPIEAPEQPSSRAAASSLDATIDLFGAVDDAFGSSSDDANQLGSRSYWGGNSLLTYEKLSGRYSFGASGSASYRRLGGASSGSVPGYSGNLHAGGPAGRRAQWKVDESLIYGPTNALPFFATGGSTEGVQAVPVVDYRLVDDTRFSSNTRGTFSYNLSRRAAISVLGGYQRDGSAASTSEGEQSVFGAYRRWELGGRYTYQQTRYASWYAGYTNTQNSIPHTDDPTTATPRLHSVDLGLMYARPLSFSRRTKIASYIGSTIVQQRFPERREWRANGSASLQHEIGRTWVTQLGYYRDTYFVPGFADPVLNDGVTLSSSGNLSRKSSLNMFANYSTGSIGLSTGSNGYRMSSASATYRYAFLRQLAAYVEYFLFDAHFESSIAFSDTFIGDSQRHGIRFGVSFGTGMWGNRRRGPLTLNGESTQ